MLDTIIITVLGIIVVIQNIYIFDDLHDYHDQLDSITETYINTLTDKVDMLDKLHEYHNELVSITEKYINKEIDIVDYNYLINDVNECIKVLESEYDEDNE